MIGLRLTVKELADMWRAAARSEGNADKAAQLNACAKDLENTHFHHELVTDAYSGRRWWRLK